VDVLGFLDFTQEILPFHGQSDGCAIDRTTWRALLLRETVNRLAAGRAVLAALAGLWLIGLGLGLISSVAVELIPEMNKMIGFVMMPAYFMSGVMMQIGAIPEPYRGYLAMNPLVHGLGTARVSFAPYYRTISDLSLAYLYGWALVLLFFGLALQVRFATRVASQ
jgi:capsular polysaccharide transport system permease protein